MTNPYHSPNEPGRVSGGPPGMLMLIIGITLVVIAASLPLLGVVAAILGIMREVEEVGQSSTPTPAELAERTSSSVSLATGGVLLGLIALPPGILLIVLSLYRRRKWRRDASPKT